SIDLGARVDALPAPGPAAERLRTLLEPLGLAARPNADGQFVISAIPTGLVEGTLKADPGGQAVPFAEVRLPSGDPAISDAEGRFRFLRVPEGPQRLHIARPGYLGRHVDVTVRAGTRHRLNVDLKIGGETRDEIFVSTAPEEPPLGTVALSTRQTRDTLLAGQDAVTSGARLPGTRPDGGYSRGVSVRGHGAKRMALVVDGLEIDEPYHLRDLGSFAGVITPAAVGQVKLHRSSPPLVYGTQSGGVLEVLTDTPDRRFTARFGAGDEGYHSALGGTALSAQVRWLAAFRNGRPDLPRDATGTNRRPEYRDQFAKLATTLHPRHELTLQTLGAEDDIDVDDFFQTFFRSPTTLRIAQQSRYSHARYLGRWGQRHLMELTAFESDIERGRFGQELQTEILTPRGTQNLFVLDDQRSTRRTGAHLRGSTHVGMRLDWRWGADAQQESTAYDYRHVGRPREPPFSSQSEFVEFQEELEQDRLGLFSEAQWRVRSDTTFKGGVRYDVDDLSDESAVMPRLSLSVRKGAGVWRASWSRVVDFPATHELPLADHDETLPGPEISDYISLGYERAWGRQQLSIEAYSQAIE
ncbi:MAG: TonB-dependent receptor, partial [Acidobacteriota bacterium]